MLMNLRTNNRFLQVSICAVALAAATLSGCSSNPLADPPSKAPNVADCAIVSIGSPTKYACNGKTYTSFALTDLRQGNPPRPK
jgi:hypothetical protein